MSKEDVEKRLADLEKWKAEVEKYLKEYLPKIIVDTTIKAANAYVEKLLAPIDAKEQGDYII